MHPLKLAPLLAFACCQNLYAQASTVNDLKTLPIKALAPRLFGEAGKLMIGIDRSNFPYDIKFFARAYAPPTQYGLCTSDWVTLHLDSETSRIWSISAGPRFGVVDSIYHFPDKQREEMNERRCALLADTKEFFPAPDWIVAQRVVSYIDYLKGLGSFKGKEYVFECTGSCDGIDGAAYVRSIELKNITDVSVIDCPEQYSDGYCYKISLKGSPPGLFPRELRIYGRHTRETAEVSRASLWVGQTLF